MFKKLIGKSLALAVVTAGVITAAIMDPNTRMLKISDLFSQYGADTFKILNGQGAGGTGSGTSHKSFPQEIQSDVATVIGSEDGNAFIMCVADSKWVVFQPDPMKLNSDAMTMTDAEGKPLVSTMIQAVRSSSNGKAHVHYTALTPDGRHEKRTAVVWNSKNLLKRKNDTGIKFICATSYKVAEATE